MEIIALGGSKSIKQQKKVIGAVALTIKLEHGTVNTAFTASLFNPDFIDVRLTLRRQGQEIPIWNNKLMYLNAHLNFENQGYANSCMNSTNWDNLVCTTILAAAGAVKEINQIEMVLPLGGSSVHLIGDDELELWINFPNEATTAAVSTGGSGYLSMEFVETSAPEIFVPRTMFKSIEGGSSNENWNVNRCVKATFLQQDKAGILAADEVVSQLTVSSENGPKYVLSNALLRALRSKILSAFDIRTREKWGQSLPLYVPTNELGWSGIADIDITMSLNSGNVNASKNHIAYTMAEIFPDRYKSSLRTVRKREAQTMYMLGGISKQHMNSIVASCEADQAVLRQNSVK